MNQARNRTAGNTLLMRVASSLCIKMAALGWPFSYNTGIKAISAHVIRPLLWVVLSSSLHIKTLRIAAFVVRVWKITTNIFNPRILKITVTNTVCTWRCWTLPLIRFERQRMQPCLRDHLLNKILKNDLLSENRQWNYTSFNVTLIYLMHDHGILRDIFFRSRQLRANKPNPSIPIIFHKFQIYLQISEKLPGF